MVTSDYTSAGFAVWWLCGEMWGLWRPCGWVKKGGVKVWLRRRGERGAAGVGLVRCRVDRGAIVWRLGDFPVALGRFGLVGDICGASHRCAPWNGCSKCVDAAFVTVSQVGEQWWGIDGVVGPGWWFRPGGSGGGSRRGIPGPRKLAPVAVRSQRGGTEPTKRLLSTVGSIGFMTDLSGFSAEN